MALRFLGQESDVVSKERLMVGLRYMLDRPQLADLVIADLARWQDWSVMDKLVTLFKQADDESSWVRVPVVNYLRACPKPEAKKYLEELAKIDPDAVKRANSFFPLGTGAPAAAKAAGDKSADSKAPAAKSDAKTDKPARAKADSDKVPPAKAGARMAPQDAGATLAMLDESDVAAPILAAEPKRDASPAEQQSAEQQPDDLRLATAAREVGPATGIKTAAPRNAKKSAAKQVGSLTLIGISLCVGTCLFFLQWGILRNNRERIVG
jgi:hypothetical protein